MSVGDTIITQGIRAFVLFLSGARTPPEQCVEGLTMTRPWEADPAADMARRLGRSPAELGNTDHVDGCPDIWELSNGDIAVIGRDLTRTYAHRLPSGAAIAEDERLVVIPRSTLISAKSDIPDA